MERKKSGIGPVIVLSAAGVAYVVFGGTARADPNEGIIDIESFLGTQASEDTVRGVRFSNIYDKLSSANITSGMHNVTSFFDGQDNRYDHRPADSNELFDIRLIYSGTTTEDKTSKLKFSFQFVDKFGNQPIVFESNNIPYGPVVDVRKGMALTPDPDELDLPLIDVPAGTVGEYGTGVLDIGTRLLADLNDDKLVNLIDFAIFAKDWKDNQGKKTSSVANITGPNGIPDGKNGYAVVDELDLEVFAEQYLTDPDLISKAMQFLPKELYEKLNQTASYILNHVGDSKLAVRFYQNQTPIPKNK